MAASTSSIRTLVALLNGLVGLLLGASAVIALAMLPDDEYAHEPEDLWLLSGWAVYGALGSMTAIANLLALGRAPRLSTRPYLLHGLNGTFHLLVIAYVMAWIYALAPADPWLITNVDLLPVAPALVTSAGYMLVQYRD